MLEKKSTGFLRWNSMKNSVANLLKSPENHNFVLISELLIDRSFFYCQRLGLKNFNLRRSFEENGNFLTNSAIKLIGNELVFLARPPFRGGIKWWAELRQTEIACCCWKVWMLWGSTARVKLAATKALLWTQNCSNNCSIHLIEYHEWKCEKKVELYWRMWHCILLTHSLAGAYHGRLVIVNARMV